MTLFYYDPIFLEHDTGRHPECAARLVPVIKRLGDTRLLDPCVRPAWQNAALETVDRVHRRAYIAEVEAWAAQGGGRIEADTMVSRRSYDVALRATGAVCDAVRRVVGGEESRAFCLVRPPGHHALADRPMGFCLFNSVAVGARMATDELQLDRVLIVDWDVHHGNGTQATFWEDPRVGFLSIHRWPFYPGTGDSDETGAGDGQGTTLNLPTPFGTSRADYMGRFTQALESFAAKLRPQLVIVSAGFDSHRADPIGSLGLESEDFSQLTQIVLEVAATYAEGRIVSVLEGGYNPGALADSVAVHLERLLTD